MALKRVNYCGTIANIKSIIENAPYPLVYDGLPDHGKVVPSIVFIKIMTEKDN